MLSLDASGFKLINPFYASFRIQHVRLHFSSPRKS